MKKTIGQSICCFLVWFCLISLLIGPSVKAEEETTVPKDTETEDAAPEPEKEPETEQEAEPEKESELEQLSPSPEKTADPRFAAYPEIQFLELQGMAMQPRIYHMAWTAANEVRNRSGNTNDRFARWFLGYNEENSGNVDHELLSLQTSAMFMCYIANQHDQVAAKTFPKTDSASVLYSYTASRPDSKVLPLEETTFCGGKQEVIAGSLLFFDQGQESAFPQDEIIKEAMLEYFQKNYPYAVDELRETSEEGQTIINFGNVGMILEAGKRNVKLAYLKDGAAVSETISAEDLMEKGCMVVQCVVQSRERTILNYLVRDLQLSPAVACGVLANMKMESDFVLDRVGDDGTSYGLCQWHNRRMEGLLHFAERQGMEPSDLDVQLTWLKYELYYGKLQYTNMMKTFQSMGNTAANAFEAAKLFCTEFEQPAYMEYKALVRARMAEEVYYPVFHGAK